ncbi:MAG TPA: NADH-quinone oxidoreductase subunit A [Candidatus Dormibacteraeota bacterium]|jgi:NADH:ubiquinone oxidoreductase subunit 3 (subunit A)|nr:NADH-quinone oxidoreductase subunit A [Candidatus Dormibacteraeota bacterium]
MSLAAAALLVFLAVVVAIPALTLGAAVVLAGRPTWLGARGRRGEPGIQTVLMLSVLVVLAMALLFVLPWAVAFGGLPHGFTAVEGLFLAVLVLAGVGYAWRRGVLRWQ